MKKRIPKSIYFIYGVGVSYAIIDQIFAQWLLYFYLPPVNSGLKPIMAPIYLSMALIVARFVDMSVDPFIGHLSDKYDSKWGKRIPFMLFGGIPLGLITILFFYPIRNNETLGFIYLASIGALFFTFYSLVAGPYQALIPEIGLEKEERLNLATSQSIFRLLYTAVAIILPGILIKVLGGGNVEKGLRLMVICLVVLALIGIYFTGFLLPEKKYSKGESSDISLGESFKSVMKDKNFIFYLIGFFLFFLGFNNLRASMNYYIEDIMGKGKETITYASALMFFVSLVAFYPTNRLSKKYGCRKLMIVSQYLMAFVAISLYFLGKIIPLEYGIYLFAFMGLPMSGAAFIFPQAMLSEISATASKKRGVNIGGMYFGIQGFVLNLAFLVSIASLPIVLTSGGNFSIMESILGGTKNVEKYGIYMVALYSFICFLVSGIFYKLFKEEK